LVDADSGFTYIEAHEMAALGMAGVAEIIQQRVGTTPVYLSIDM
jgi:arginase family enzyme